MLRIRTMLVAPVIMAQVASAVNPVRKHAILESVASNGEIHISEGLVDSTPNLSASLVRHAKKADSIYSKAVTDVVITASGGILSTMRKASPILMRSAGETARTMLGGVAANDGIKLSDAPASSTLKASSGILHGAEEAVSTFASVGIDGDGKILDPASDLTLKASPCVMHGAKEADNPSWGNIAADGDSKISDCLVHSTPIVRHAKETEDAYSYSGSVAADGDINILNGLADLASKASPSIVRSVEAERTLAGSVDAEGFVKVSGDLADITRKLSTSLVRNAYYKVDANGKMETFADDGQEAQSTARDPKRDQDSPREDIESANANVEYGEDSKMLTYVWVPRSLKMRFVTLTIDFLRSVFPVIRQASSRFTNYFLLHASLTSYSRILVSFVIIVLLCMTVSLYITHINVRRSDASRDTFSGRMLRVGRRLISSPDAGSEPAAREELCWEGSLWKLNSKVAAAEQPGWDHWRKRQFLLEEGVAVVDDIESVGVYIEFISEKDNMERVRFWATERKPAILSRLEPVRMWTPSFIEKQSVLTKTNQYELAVDSATRTLSTELPRTLFPLTITFQETDASLTVASSSWHVINELARRLKPYSKHCEDGVSSSSGAEPLDDA